MSFRAYILKFLNKLFPVPRYGNAGFNHELKLDISCIINFYGRTDLLKNILSCLCEQDLDKSRFEVLLVEDRNGTVEGSKIANEYSGSLNIKYMTLTENFGTMGYSRNLGISESTGRYILFLDDDTIILNNSFLTRMLEVFDHKQPDGIMPKGYASFCQIKNRYQYHDPFFPTNRCMAYTRDTLFEMKGFNSNIIGQEDVEFAVRLSISDKKIIEEPGLIYFHPPLLQNNYNKSAAVGLSYYNLKKEYPFIIWILLLINGCRYLPLGVLSFREKYINQFRFSMGFLIGIIYGIRGKKVGYK